MLLLLFGLLYCICNCSSLPDASCQDLKCFLSSLELQIPSQEFQGKIVFTEYTVTINDITCSKFALDNFASQHNGLEISIDVSGVSLECSGNWKVKYGLLDGHGEVVASESANTALEAEAKILTNSSTLEATGVTLDHCNFNSDLSIVFKNQPKFFEDIEHDIFDAFKSNIDKGMFFK